MCFQWEYTCSDRLFAILLSLALSIFPSPFTLLMWSSPSYFASTVGTISWKKCYKEKVVAYFNEKSRHSKQMIEEHHEKPQKFFSWDSDWVSSECKTGALPLCIQTYSQWTALGAQKLGQDSFLPYVSQFIIHPIIRHYIVGAAYSVVK
jgi:hypothetical protein